MSKRLNAGILLGVLAFLILCPLVSIFLKAVMVDGHFDFMHAVSIINESGSLEMIGNSLLLSLLVVLLSTVIAFPLAWLFSRTKFAHYKVFDILFMVPFMTPPYIDAMGWILFMQKNGLFMQIFKGSSNPKWFFSLFGLVLVMSFHIFPFLYTILRNAMLRIPSSLEESGAVYGAGFRQRMQKIFLPLVSGNYAIGALLVFVKTLSEYGTPYTLGRRINFEVFTTQIHRYATVAPVAFDKAAALASVLAGICILMWFLQNVITARHTYNLVGTRGSRRMETKLSKGGTAAAWIFVIAVIVIAIGIPYFSIIATSFIKLRGYGLQAGNFTFQNYIDLFSESAKGLRAIGSSLFLAVSSATICSVLGTMIVLCVRSLHSKAGKTLEAVGLMPQMLPAIVMVIGIMLFWNAIYKAIPLYNTMGIMVLAYTILYLPYTIQYVTSSISQIGTSLESAGRVFGGSPWYVFRRITFPLIRKGILTGWSMIFIISIRELVTASLIAPPNVLVISTFIMREFEQGSVSIGMCMAVLTVLFTVTALLIMNHITGESAVDSQ